MLLNIRQNGLGRLLFFSILLLLTTTVSLAQEKETEKKKPETKDFFAVPKGDVPALLNFINKVLNHRPRTTSEALQFRLKAPTAIKEAAEKILELDKDKKSPARQAALELIFQLKAGEVLRAGPKAQRAFIAELREHFQSKVLTENDYALAAEICGLYESALSPEAAVEAYTIFAEVFIKSEKAAVVRSGEMLAGAARRLTLLGKKIEVKGETLAGEKFDLSSLKGKVVLVDFWATWCGPCIAEQPVMKRYYRQYKDRGFEIVAISIDDDRRALERFVADQGVPWITLHSKDGDHATARYYGVQAIPTMFLVNKEGKVISLEARGPNLGALLEKELRAE